ncbi:hypothetical protein Cs7R123_32980 [Catellatospora sp. TT07R-123]|uniref:hypothetical protein n=1 Tax=Catellatospora sp. TT07R-123 TaxID=2733863 RepID=UPI001B22E75D|nr:hypothetical protein [Catellatospora sp. TT07R-123]GHJ45956.1 hypothetical protein Cs7R123_32980 [Catellatospora sp. TT07R-123]
MPVVVGVIGLVVLLVLCLGGGAAGYYLLRRNGSAPSPSAAAAPASPLPSVAPPAPSRAPQDCLVGDWLETSYTSNVEFYDGTVQLTGKGVRFSYGADGVLRMVYNTTRKGTRSGDRYEVIHKGNVVMNYVADEKTINYSSPQTTGTTTLKINGSTNNSQKLTMSVNPDSYSCKGDELRLFGEDYAMEATRVLPPGQGV